MMFDVHPFAARVASFLACLLLLVALAGCEKAASTRAMDLDPETKPYTLEPIQSLFFLHPGEHFTLAFAEADIDGDGLPELVQGNTQKFLGFDSVGNAPRKPRWEIHLPDGLYLDDEVRRFGVGLDISGDNVDEIFFTVRNQDMSAWWLMGLDPATQTFFRQQELPQGEDRRRPDHWDGYWAVVGILDSVGEGTGPALLLMHRSGYDATYRGFCAVSPETGEFLWDFVSGMQPVATTVKIVDLDGDGEQEICWATSAPSNWGGREINGFSDDVARVVVMNNRGELLFHQEINVLFSGGGLMVRDMNGDGVMEVISATETGSAGGNCQLTIHDWRRGTVLASHRRVPGFRGLAMVDGPRPGTTWIFAGSRNGSLARFLFEGDRLLQDSQLLVDQDYVAILGQGDFLPARGDEIFVDVGEESTLLVINTEMEELAVLDGRETGAKDTAVMQSEPADGPLLIVGGYQGQWVLDYKRNPRQVLAYLKLVGMLVLGGLVLIGTFLLGRQLGRRTRPVGADVDSASRPAGARVRTDRQALFNLYKEMSDINHQVLGQAKGLQRLVWLMDAYTTQIGDRAAMEQRILEVAYDFHNTVYPALLSVLNQAGKLDLEPDSVARTREVLAGLVVRVERLLSGGLEPEQVAAQRLELKDEWAQAVDGFLGLRGALNAHFVTDPVRMFKGMVLIRTEELEREGITTVFREGEGFTAGTLVRIDSSDLRFVLDNLLDNALRALKDRGDGRLEVEAARRGDEVTLQISDNGAGIESHLHETIFNRRFSSHPGGGHGLFRTREILTSWGGEIVLAHSHPGKGTTFIVKLLAADEEARPLVRLARG
jgi:signal transduction histidine kinase